MGRASWGLPLDLPRDFWEYDPLTDSWTRKADFPGSGRAYALAFAMGTKGYVTQGLLGMTNGGASVTLGRDLWEYDAQQDAWTRRTDFPGAARTMAVGFAIGPTGWIGLGTNASGQDLRDLWALVP